MGVKGLVTYVKGKCSNLIRTIQLKDLIGMKLGADAMNLLYRYKSVSQYMSTRTIYPKNPVEFFINMIGCLHKHKIDIVFVFDGKAPDEKKDTQLKRRSTKDTIRAKAQLYRKIIRKMQHKNPNLEEVMDLLQQVTGKRPADELSIPPIAKLSVEYDKLQRQVVEVGEKEINQLKMVLKTMGVPYITAEGEAEKLCAQLTIDGTFNACLSTDSDVLAYGCPYYIREIDTVNETCQEIELEDVLETLTMNHEQFLDFCIMCGTDYNNNIPGIGPGRAHKLLLKSRNLEHVEIELGEEKCQILNYRRVRELFKDQHRKITPYKLERSKPDRKAFMELMKSMYIRINDELINKLF